MPPLQQFLNETPPNPNQMAGNFDTEHANLMQQIGQLAESGNDMMVPLIRDICLRLTEVIDCMTAPGRSAIATGAELVQVLSQCCLIPLLLLVIVVALISVYY